LIIIFIILVILKRNEGELEYKDNSFCQTIISWYDMEFIEFFDSIGINHETSIMTSQSKKESEMGIINLNETDLENMEIPEKMNVLKLILVSGHFGEFDNKKSKKNIEIVINLIGSKNSLLNNIKLYSKKFLNHKDFHL